MKQRIRLTRAVLSAALWLVPALSAAETGATGATSPAAAPAATAAAPLPPVGPVMALPALISPDLWSTPAADGAVKAIAPAGSYLRIDAVTMKGQTGEARLKAPQPLPAWADDLYFRCTNSDGSFSFQADVIVTDSKNREFYFYSKSSSSYEQGLVVSHPQRRATEYWHHVPAFAALMRNNYAARDNNYHDKPQPPFTFAGLRLRGQYNRWSDKDKSNGEVSLYFAGFALTGLSPRATSFYYQFADQEFFGELAPLPYLTPGQALRNKWGNRYSLSWELRKEYSGQPLLTGGTEAAFLAGKPENQDARAADMARHLDIPVKEEGTYWVRVRTRWHSDKQPLPNEIEEKEFRLYIDKGDKGVVRGPVPAEAFAPGCYVRVAPARPTLSFAADEAFRLPVLFRKPADALPDLAAQVTVRNAAGDTVYTQTAPAPQWNAQGQYEYVADLTALTPGSYELTAALTSGGKDYDRATRLIGRAYPAAAGNAAAVPIPATVASWKEVLSRPDPLLFLCLCLPDNDNSRNDAKLAWEKHHKPFLDDAGDLSKVIELQVPWDQVERLPGIYDWAAVDRIIAYAGSKGYTVSITPEFRSGAMPEWVPSVCEKNPDGRIFGSNSYLFHNTRPNFLLAPEIREPLFRFIRTLVQRYRDNPAVFAYFLCAEHPRDAAYQGWYEGFSAENLPFFRAHCEKKFPNIAALNKEWGTAFQDFAAVRHPQEGDPAAFRAGWLAFRIDAIEAFLKDFVGTVRSVDDRRLVLVYTDGLRDIAWFRDQGCMTADGGSATGMGILQAKAFGKAGFHRRTEDINPGYWASEKFPTEIEASLFNISSGGAWTNHAKCYVRADKKTVRQQLAEPAIGLGKMKKLWPVWQELHQAHAYDPQVYVYGNLMSALYRSGSTNYGDEGGGAWAILNAERAQLNPGAIRGSAIPAEAKMVLIIDQNMTHLPMQDIDALAKYAENGGTLVTFATNGRNAIEPYVKEDWVLLRRLGFGVPEEKSFYEAQAPAQTVKGGVYPVDGEGFLLREAWRVKFDPAAHGERLALYKGHPESCAVSWKPVGKGKAVIIWADTIVPTEKPFLQEIAQWAGADIRVTTDQPGFWTNLQFTQDGKKFYGMVNNVAWPTDAGKTLSGTVRWLAVPDGTYQVKALVADKTLGVMPAAKLREGFTVTLPPRGAEFFRFEKQ